MGCLQRLVLGAVAVVLIATVAGSNIGNAVFLAVLLGAVIGMVGKRVWG